MRKLLAVAGSGLQSDMSYRGAYWAGLLGAAIQIAVSYFVWTALFDARKEIGGLTKTGMVAYIVLSAVLVRLNAFGAGRQLSLRIARGEIAVDLVRPLHPVLSLLAFNGGQKVAEMVRSTAVIVLLGALVLRVQVSASLLSWACFFAFALIGMLTVQLVDLLVATLAFVTTNTWGIWLLRDAVFSLFSGALVPLMLFPQWFQDLSQWLPFRGALFDPVNVLLHDTGASAGPSALRLVLWCAACIGLIGLSWNALVRRATVQGG